MTAEPPFSEGVRYLLETWPALHVAFGYTGGGFVASSQIASNLHSEVVDYFTQYGEAIFAEDMVQFFDDFLEDVLETTLDDQSVEKVALSLRWRFETRALMALH